MTRNKSSPGQGTNDPALDNVRPLDVPLPFPTTFPKVTMPTNHRLRLDQDRINMQMLRKAKGDPNNPYAKLYNNFIRLFPPEEDVLVHGQWKVKSTSADIMNKEYEESEALAWLPSAHLDEQSKIKGTKKPWPAHLRSDRAPFFGKSCTRVAVTMSEEWDTARTIMIAIEDYGKACAFYYRWMIDVKGAKNVSDCPVCLKSSENWPWTMDHIIFQHTSEQIHRLPLQAHNFLGLKVFNYYASPAGRPWVPAHKRFIDEAADRYNADKRALEIARAQRLENNSGEDDELDWEVPTSDEDHWQSASEGEVGSWDTGIHSAGSSSIFS